MSSGSVLSPWAVASDAVDYSKKLAAALGCPNEAQRNALMLYCLRQKSAEELVAVSFEVPSHLASFGPTVDGMVIPNEPSLLMGDLPSLYGNYDLMFGVTQAEGYNGISHMEKRGIDPARRDRILRTLVRNLFTYHLQVSSGARRLLFRLYHFDSTRLECARVAQFAPNVLMCGAHLFRSLFCSVRRRASNGARGPALL